MTALATTRTKVEANLFLKLLQGHNSVHDKCEDNIILETRK